MKSHEIVKALVDGKTIDNLEGHRYKYDGFTLYKDVGTGWLPSGLSVTHILQYPNHYRVIE